MNRVDTLKGLIMRYGFRVFAVVSAAGLGLARADVVAFDSTSTLIDGWEQLTDLGARYESNSLVEIAGGLENDGRTGDVITLAGSGRTITQFQTRYFRNVAPSSSVLTFKTTLTLYTLSAGMPDQVIWSGQMTGTFPTSGFGTDKLDLNFAPNIDVPETFGFGISIDDIPNVGYGSGPRFTFATPTVGSSPSTILVQDSTSLAWRTEDPHFHNIEAKVWTIPGPGGLGLGVAGGLVALRRRR